MNAGEYKSRDALNIRVTDQLEDAVKNSARTIIIKGSLAKDLNRFYFFGDYIVIIELILMTPAVLLVEYLFGFSVKDYIFWMIPVLLIFPVNLLFRRNLLYKTFTKYESVHSHIVGGDLNSGDESYIEIKRRKQNSFEYFQEKIKNVFIYFKTSKEKTY